MIPSDLQELLLEKLDMDQVITRVLGYIHTRADDDYYNGSGARVSRLIGNVISYRKDKVEICKKLMYISLSSTNNYIRRDIRAIIRYTFFNYNPYNGELTSEVKSKLELKNRYYPYIPSNPGDVINEILRIIKENPKITKQHLRFLDVGCGIGDKPLFAYTMGIESSSGIEYNRHTFELARYFLKDTEVKLIKGDALKYKHYSNYNLVYMYNPILDYKIELKLLYTIYDQLEVGSTILYFGGGRSWGTFKGEIDSSDDDSFITKKQSEKQEK